MFKFTHINGYLNRVEYLYLHIFISTNDGKLSMTVSCVYKRYKYTRMPPRLADHLTNGSTFGELLLLLLQLKLTKGCLNG